ncbi:ExeM/NucH family extracellular endonuclease [Agrococcus sp. Ld7]|uniref:ExeM/NucH family extracellular endonuclease n=1 Tax=Agrococcus sp. Ld7 TaxID=649148 RepID=UPI003869E007
MRARTLLGTGTVAALALTGIVATPAVAADHPVINEFSANVDGSDTGYEFVELYAAPGTDLSGHQVVIVEGDSGDRQGQVLDVSAAPTLDANGFGVVYPASFQNNSASVLLIDGSVAAQQQLDADGDGTIDASNEYTVIDAVGVSAGATGDVAYGTELAANFDGGTQTVGGASRIPDGTDTDAAGDWVRNDYNKAGFEGFDGPPANGIAWNTPGASNEVFELEEPPTDGVCGSDAVIAIGAVQGDGEATPLSGQTVTVEGTVVGDWQDGGFAGFTLQDAGDADSATSDGIFVYAPDAAEVAEGDLVQVTGTAGENFGMTQISNVALLDCGAGTMPAATELVLPIADHEPTESMLVTLPQTLSILEYFNYGRFGQVVVGTERQMQPTAVAAPGSAEAAAIAAANAVNRITIDDGRSAQNPDPAIHPANQDVFTLENAFRGGDTITGITGVLDWRFDTWAVQPTDAGTYGAVNERPAAPEIEGASLEIASFNVLNYFTTLGSRGAETAEEFDRQEAKIVAAINELGSAVVGLLEIENNDGAALDALVAALNEAAGSQQWAGIDTGTIGTDAITTAVIYQPALVAPEGDFAVLDSSVDARFDDGKNRPALTQSFRDLATDRVLTVAVNHLKSKGSACDGDQGSPEQGNCNEVRTQAAAALADWMAGSPTGVEADGSLIIGDLNSYDHEDPITTLEDAGWTDLLEEFQGEDAYTYVFDGQLGYLDYGLADPAMLPFVAGAEAWHANADEPSIIDYSMAFKKDAQDALFAPDPYRASDHDAVVIGLDWEMAVPPETVVESFAGVNRYETNALVSAATFEPGADVLLASGDLFPDALAAGPAAASVDASLLLTRADALPSFTADELERLQPASVTIIGGTPSISSAVVAQVLEIVPNARVERIAGQNRYETAAMIAERYFDDATEAFIASGQVFADAVSASGTAAVLGDVPVLLTPQARADGVTIAALTTIGIESATVLGGQPSVSDAALRGYRDTGVTVTRLAGADRYATNAMLVSRFITPGDDQAIAMASGLNFPDALSASMVAGAHDAPVLLAVRSCVLLSVEEQIAELAPVAVYNVGGLPALSPEAWRTSC